MNFLDLINTTTAEQVSPSQIALTYDAGTNTANFTFPGFPNGVLPVGDYTATIDGSLPDSFGNLLGVETPFSFTVAIPPPQLPGDYNQNGEVDAADYIVWRKTLGSDVPNYAGADGDGDGHVGPEDYDVWRAHFGETLPMAGAGSADVAAEPQSQGFVFISTARLPQSGDQITLLATPTMLATGMQQAPAKDSEMLTANMLSDSGEFTSTAYEMALAAKNPGPRASDSPFGKSRHSVYTAPRANHIIDAALMVWPSQRWQRMPADLDLTNGAVGNASSSASLHSQSLDIAISDPDYGVCALIKSLS